ncbi:hypothetical protein [Paenibacillus larvae]|uniref:Uncharacterized protein n=1 Tax=Paenibacillus larvae subsp. larvae TaxID=147375 RepID=A0A6C0QPT9_9BACL|nr:hypothetical protein [Paenibacillus larvae]QHZ50739.1 hypothetical protein ERICV_01581 [Paenibacillus larvae subsp. larvae]
MEKRAKCDLSMLLTDVKWDMALEGVKKSKVDKVNKIDIIQNDFRLLQIYLLVLKEMGI